MTPQFPYLNRATATTQLHQVLADLPMLNPREFWERMSRIAKESTGMDHAIELQAQLVPVQTEGGTGKAPCAQFCEARANGLEIKQLRSYQQQALDMLRTGETEIPLPFWGAELITGVSQTISATEGLKAQLDDAIEALENARANCDSLKAKLAAEALSE